MKALVPKERRAPHFTLLMKVLVTVPCGTGWIRKEVSSLLTAIAQDNRIEATILLPKDRPVENNMNKCAKMFLDGDYDYWLTLDDDNPCIKNPIDLIELHKDVIGLPTPVRKKNDRGDFMLNTYVLREGRYVPVEGAGLTRVDAVGTGCMLISRKAMESIEGPPFVKVKDKDGIVIMGHDFYFCKKVREAGLEVWTHYDYPCSHFKEIDLLTFHDRAS